MVASRERMTGLMIGASSLTPAQRECSSDDLSRKNLYDIPRILGLCAEAVRVVSRVSTAKRRRSRP